MKRNVIKELLFFAALIMCVFCVLPAALASGTQVQDIIPYSNEAKSGSGVFSVKYDGTDHGIGFRLVSTATYSTTYHKNVYLQSCTITNSKGESAEYDFVSNGSSTYSYNYITLKSPIPDTYDITFCATARDQNNSSWTYYAHCSVTLVVRKSSLSDIISVEPYSGIYDGTYHKAVTITESNNFSNYIIGYRRSADEEYVSSIPNVKNALDSGIVFYRITTNDQNFTETTLESSLESIILPDNLQLIDDYAFYNCSSLTSISIPDTVTSVGYQAFAGCSIICFANEGSSASLALSKAGYSFRQNGTQYSLKYTFGDDETVSGLGITAVDKNVTSIIIPANVTRTIGTPFAQCQNLEEIDVDPGNTALKSVDGMLLNDEGTVLIACPPGATGTCSIPYSVVSIETSAFQNCSKLTEISFPSGITRINNNTLYGCSSLMSITIPASVNTIGDNVFVGCSSLETITLLGNMPSISNTSFADCSNVNSISCTNGTIHPSQSTLSI